MSLDERRPDESSRQAPALIRHLERHLGPIASGWSRDLQGHQLPFQIVLFENAPGPGNLTFTTLGLSNVVLTMNSGQTVRQELVFICHQEFRSWNPQIVLQSVGLHAIESRHALHRGQCLGPLKLFAQSEANGLYSAIPVYFPDSFNSVRLSDSTGVVFTWLVPLYQSELDWCRSKGWKSLESQLERQDPDLMDLGRPPLELR